MSNAQSSRALVLFTDRDDQRAAIDAFLTRLHDGAGHQQSIVLSFYGVGGVGKTTLRQKALAEFREKLSRDKYDTAPFHIAQIDLDTDSVQPELPVPYFLGRVRNALLQAGIATPLFDYVYLEWWREENPEQAIHLQKPHDGVIGGLLSAADLIGSLARSIGVSLPTGVARGAYSVLEKVAEWFDRSRARHRFDGSPGGWTQRDREERMPVLLALDLLEVIARQPQRSVCLVIDGFDRVQSKESRSDAQWSLAMLVSEILHCAETVAPASDRLIRARIGFLVFGRERLRWSDLYARERIRVDWTRQVDTYAELTGLTLEDAQRFLIDKSVTWERDHGRAEVADLILRHANAVLLASAEHRHVESASYLPYYMDLAVLIIRDNAGQFTPGMLGETPAELERRFLRSLASRHLRALQVLALCLEFDRELLEFLIARGFVTGYASTDFGWLVGDHWSFVSPVGDRPGFHGFHRHMQASLIASLAAVDELQRAREIVVALLDQLATKMRFERPVDFQVAQARAFGDAMDLLRAHHASGVLAAQVTVEWAMQFSGRFKGAHALSFRAPLAEWCLRISRLMEPAQPAVLAARANYADVVGAAGDPTKARDLFELLLPDQIRLLGPDHPETLRTRGNLAVWTGSAGDPRKARDLCEELLPDQERVLGGVHVDILTTRSNIGVFTGNGGDPAKGRDLCEELLPEQMQVLGRDHPDTLRTRGNVAAFVGNAGNSAKARDLFEELLPDQTRLLGRDHPDTLRTRGNLALWTGNAGDPANASDLLERLLPDQIRVLGQDHPETLRTRNHIGAMYGMAGSPAKARDLFEGLLIDQTRVLGLGHPDTLATRSKLAVWSGNTGDPAKACELLERLLPDQMRVLGHDHPGTLEVRGNLALWTGIGGNPSKALQWFEGLLPDQVRVLGPDHPETLTTRSRMADCIGNLGRPAQARDLFESLVPDKARVLGHDHPDTLRSRANLGIWAGSAGDPAKARDLYSGLLPDLVRVLGRKHPGTLDARAKHALWTGIAGDPAGARELFEGLLSDQRCALGPDHPETFTTRTHIASFAANEGDLMTAREILEGVQLDQVRVLGADDPGTLTTRNNLAAWHASVGDRAGALALFEQLVLDLERVLGPRHPTTETAVRWIALLRGGAESSARTD